ELALEAGEGAAVGARQGLQGHHLAVVAVVGGEHLSHPTAAEPAAELEAGGEGVARDPHCAAQNRRGTQAPAAPGEATGLTSATGVSSIAYVTTAAATAARVTPSETFV